MTIKLANISDIPDLCNLLYYLFEQEADFTPDEEKQTKGLSLILENENYGHILIAKKDDVAIGMVCILYTVSTALGSKVAIIEDVIVHPHCRNSGIGSELIDSACEFAREQGCARATLLTDIDNENAHRFYMRHGFNKSTMVPFRKLLYLPKRKSLY